MERTVIGSFATRRDAETAVEHLVQEYGIQRTDVSIQAAGDANSAGTRPAGADIESGHPGVEKHRSPELRGAVEQWIVAGPIGKSESSLRKCEEETFALGHSN